MIDVEAGANQATIIPTRVEHVRATVENLSLKTCALVACVAGSSLGLELIQTRILSFLYYNHVVYLTVTIALLGFGISGVLVSLFSSRCQNPDRAIALLTAGFVLSSYTCLAVVSRIPEHLKASPTTTKLIVSYIALVGPFLLSGAVLGWVFMKHGKSINRLYAIDLASSSGAVMAFLLLLWPLGGDWFVWLCTAIALFGFVIYSHGVIGIRSIGVVTAIALLSVLTFNSHLLGKRPEAYKTLARAYERNDGSAKLESTQWTPLTRIDLWSDSRHDPVLGMPSTDAADLKMITQDADAFTILWGPNHVTSALETAKRGGLITALSLTYRLKKNPQDSLIIGVGGGVDMVTARAHGAQHVTGVEINPATVNLVNGPYRDFVLWPKWEGVTEVRAEGRNFLRAKHAAYDTIVMSGVDTFSALNTGAYLLSENYLYTVEAMEDYLRALKPGGVMAIYRWFFVTPRESLRLAGLFQQAAERLNLPHPEQCILVVAEDLGWNSYRWAATFVKPQPFTVAEVQELLAAIGTKPSLSVVYLPKVFPGDVQQALERDITAHDPALTFARISYNRFLTSAAGKQRQEFIQSYTYRIEPVHDDRPFFFEYFKPTATGIFTLSAFSSGLNSIRGPAGYYVLYLLLVLCALICFICILLPLWIFQRRGLKTPGAIPLLLFFASLGFGFMMFEVGAMQRLNVYVGDPAYSLALVLAGLLVSVGIGAGLSGRLSQMPALRVMRFAMVAVTLGILAWLGITDFVHPRTMALPLIARAVIVLIGIMPIGVLLGFPFPTAVKELEKYYPNFIAWAWGVNGVTSVLASIVAIVVAMKIGFTVVALIASATYLLGLAAYQLHCRALAR